MVQRLSDNRAMLPVHLCFSFLIALMSFDDISYASFLPDPGVQFGGDPYPTPARLLLEKCVHDFQLLPFRKIDDRVSSAIARAKPKRSCAGL